MEHGQLQAHPNLGGQQRPLAFDASGIELSAGVWAVRACARGTLSIITMLLEWIGAKDSEIRMGRVRVSGGRLSKACRCENDGCATSGNRADVHHAGEKKTCRAKPGRDRSNLAEAMANLADVGPKAVDSGRVRAEVEQHWGKFHRHRPNLARNRPELDRV